MGILLTPSGQARSLLRQNLPQRHLGAAGSLTRGSAGARLPERGGERCLHEYGRPDPDGLSDRQSKPLPRRASLFPEQRLAGAVHVHCTARDCEMDAAAPCPHGGALEMRIPRQGEVDLRQTAAWRGRTLGDAVVVSRRNFVCLMGLALAGVPALPVGPARADSLVRIGVLKFGTVSWELDTIKHHGLDAANGIDLDVSFFAGEDASNVAMLSGNIDIIVTDWLWVSRQRSMGGDVALVPYSMAVGAIMVRQDSPIRSPGDLTGKKIGVAGGPLDKSWLLLQALFRRDHDMDLAERNEIVFGAPPLLSEK